MFLFHVQANFDPEAKHWKLKLDKNEYVVSPENFTKVINQLRGKSLTLGQKANLSLKVAENVSLNLKQIGSQEFNALKEYLIKCEMSYQAWIRGHDGQHRTGV